MPDFKVIDGDGPGKEEREKQEREYEEQRARDWAKSDVERTLSGFSAALLRTMAGSETESIYLMRRLVDFLDALNKFRDVMGRGVSVVELQEILRVPTTEPDYSDDDWRHRHWIREHGMDVIVKGALRLAAHKILGEEPHFGGKYSEDVIQDGIKTLEELKRPPKPRPPLVKGLSKWDDVVDLGPSKPSGATKRAVDQPVVAQPRKRQSDQGFSEGDLKELRKAIKARDSKRIAELTSKIGRRPIKE
ncbi:hypothetical protein [Bradyrhizobium sp. NAS96.2]|uniref:hypothetical protein n=1 Tax=Bradyrhizobium sp. NAS96.2 TaxID=1680160 RepID=UPI000938BDA7|nr:hypothetical protein [Bradyrhizobium sp. NAS96.2]OKO67773.1 hypothetical protein AC628_37970 [Bradyrhizobium sp. NAS96.2]